MNGWWLMMFANVDDKIKLYMWIFSIAFCLSNLFAVQSFHHSNALVDRVILGDYAIECLDPFRNCSSKVFQINIELTVDLLKDLIETQGRNVTYITIYTNYSASMYNILDDFITSRPWWIIRKQPFENQYYSGSKNQPLVFQRVPYHMEAMFRMISAINFPLSSEDCKNRSLYFAFIDSTWGNGLFNMDGHHSNNHRSVFVPYTTRTNNYNDNVFLSDGDCRPGIMNKWECLFLRPTTCKLPSSITNCRSRWRLYFYHLIIIFIIVSFLLSNDNNNHYYLSSHYYYHYWYHDLIIFYIYHLIIIISIVVFIYHLIITISITDIIILL